MTSTIQKNDGNAFDYCACWRCKKVKYNCQNNIWYHEGTGIMNNETFRDAKLGSIVDSDLFIQPTSMRNFSAFKLINHPKPVDVIWFSHGSWLFDPYCDSEHCNCIGDHCYCRGVRGNAQSNAQSNAQDNSQCQCFDGVDHCNGKKSRVIEVINPKNILTISTKEEFEMFVEKYAGTKLTDEYIKYQNMIKALENNTFLNCIVDVSIPLITHVTTSFDKIGLDFNVIKNFICEELPNNKITKYNFAKTFLSSHPGFAAPFEKSSIHYKNPSKRGLFEMEIMKHSYPEYMITEMCMKVFDCIVHQEIKKKLSNISQYEKDYQEINWDQVYDNGSGYWGVAFEFRKTYHIGFSDEQIFDPKCYWHIGFDSESLCIFDTKALETLMISEVCL